MKTISKIALSLVCATVLSGCYKDCDQDAEIASPGEIIRFDRIDNLPAFADSSTQILVRVKVGNENNSFHEVTLTASAGLVNGATGAAAETTNIDGYANFYFTPGQVASAVKLRTKVGENLYRDTSITLLPAYPDLVLLQPDTYTMTKNTTLNADLKLIRYNGYPSKGQTIVLSAVDATSGGTVGTLVSSGSFQPGSDLELTFTPNADYTGIVLLKAVIIQSSGAQQSATVQVTVES